MRTVILFQPMMGYYDKVARDLPAALLSVASYIHDKYEVIIIDQRVPGWKTKLNSALKMKPLCFGIATWTGVQLKFSLEVTKYVKSISNVPIVWGGIHPSTTQRQTMENRFVDFIVEGEGELTFPKFLKTLEDGGDFSKINGLWYKEDDKIKNGKSFEKRESLDMDKLNKIPYHLLNLKDYEGRASSHSGKAFLVETGRGCPRRCAYCYNTMFNQGSWRTVSAEKMIQNIKDIVEWSGTKDLFFIDDNFFSDRKRTLKFVELLKREKLDIRWGVECEIYMLNKMDDNLLQELENVGLRSMSIGVESGSKRIIKMLDKVLNLDHVEIVNRRLAKFNFDPMYNFMGGYITETEEELKETLSLIVRILEDNRRAHIQGMGMVVPYPGTPYLNMAKKVGLNEPQSLEGWFNYNPDDWIWHNPLVSEKTRKLFKTLHISSLFVDRKSFTHISGNSIYGVLVKLFFLLYHRIARIRFRYASSFFPLEVKLFETFKKVLVKSS